MMIKKLNRDVGPDEDINEHVQNIVDKFIKDNAVEEVKIADPIIIESKKEAEEK